MSIKALQDYTFVSKYARYIPEKKRRETWSETVDRVKDMMLKKYADIPAVHEDIEWAYDMMRKRRVLGSQRALQFGGKPVFDHNMRLYNCISSFCDRPRFFQECMYLLLCGCGTGFSVQTHHIDKLPNLIKEKDGSRKWMIEDSIEGWSEAVGVLVGSYFNIKKPHWNDNIHVADQYIGRNISFDFSLIREAGSPLSHGGKAPGPEPLKKALSKIKEILDNAIKDQKKLKPIQCYDIVMHSSDAVISGGVRRSATIAVFSPHDEEMAKAKTGNWFAENPQRGRSNNSALLVRDETSREMFSEIMKSVKEFGEPGFVFSDSKDLLVNPCVTADTVVSTKNGLETAINLQGEQFKAVVDGKTYNSTEKGFWKTGHKEILRLEFKSGRILKVTPNHQIMTTNGWVEAGDLTVDDEIVINNHRNYMNIPDFGSTNCAQGYLLGSFLGDGNVNKTYAELKWWGEDKDKYRNDAVKILKQAGFDSGHTLDEQNSKSVYASLGSVKLLDFAKNMECFTDGGKKLSTKGITGDWDYLAGLVAGYFDADGTVLVNPKKGSSVRICSSQLDNLRNIQIILNAFGMYSKIYQDRVPAGHRKLPDGNGGYKEYFCQETHELVLSCDNIEEFLTYIPIQNTDKRDKINEIIESRKRTPNRTHFVDTLYKVTNLGQEDVYDCTINDIHAFDANGVYVHNCVEIGFWPVCEKTGKSGWQACNLSTINCSKVKDEVDFYEAAKAAAIIGTLQAGFTDVGYLEDTSKNILEREALIGVSMTGIMEQHEICLSPRLQKEAAKIVKKINKEIAAKIGINQAARCTCVKPEGTASCILGTSSGIHPHHAKRYIRRVQANKMEEIYKYFQSVNPRACEESVWSANDTDDVISFCIEVPDGSKTKNQISAIDLLESVKSTQQNWVINGTNKTLCTQPWLVHNVSNTINVTADEWEKVEEFIYNNRKWFCGISLLPVTGDKDYPQAPFTAIYLPSKIISHYGDGAMFVSGLIEGALQLWEDNLWAACDSLLGIGTRPKGGAKQEWIARCEKFAGKYFQDIKSLTYCMKDVYNYKLWTELNKEYVDVDFKNVIEQEDKTNFEGDSACSGGACEITKL